MADKITITAPANTPKVGEKSEIVLAIGEGAGTGPLNVAVKSQLTPKPLEVQDNGNSTMTISFVPRATGKHEFDLTWADAPIPGGHPLILEVTGEVHRDASKVTVKGEKLGQTVTTNTDFVLEVTAPEEAGPGPLQVDASGPAEPVIDLKNTGGGNFTVTIKGPKAGTYKVGINWGDNNPVPGSPFEVKFADA
eukprot:TRINITY_DN480_c0_g1_i1.p1 TRINITY_DN480_c0_g1~~TRINITY_DN480_c0_g1_i1.p1  ORF type:complete len:193 (-),score=33.09 TRINITY_DN480_c0_g1_i1:12-590(-)